MPTAVCLMGPTASGKTDVAIALCKRFPLQIVSVDSAMVYRGMDIGTAKPDKETLKRAPHRLIDIRDPHEPYSAGDFVRDATAEMAAIHAAGRVPLLVGGTMLYFRALTEGIAELPGADAAVRAEIDAAAAERGWPALHEELQSFDPKAAARIKPNDSQRLQRAIEVFRLSGRSLSDWQSAGAARPTTVDFAKIGLVPGARSVLHDRISERLKIMLNSGFIEEVEALSRDPRLARDTSSMRAVGYRQLLEHVAGDVSLEEASYRALVATRQLAKRQFTWLRSESDLYRIDPLETSATETISAHLAKKLLQLGT